ncbi:MAG: bifunctional glutamate N-acetyltransferase/amino-acid acetyltransferase ArgJ [Pseudomonadota bacterium]
MIATPDKISPLAPKKYVKAPPVQGVHFATAAAHIRYPGRQDVLLMAFDEGTAVAGVFTRSKCPSAAVDWCRKILPQGKARALVVNSGNANAFTGKLGILAAEKTAQSAAQVLKCKADEVSVASTGVIGEPLDASKIERVMPDLATRAMAGDWLDAARAIMTTDTFPKLAAQKVGHINIVGIAKGAGMIQPDMATLLSFVFTDAKIAPQLLQKMLARATERSFNRVTVDGDTSTSDTLLAFATGKSAELAEGSAEAKSFERALIRVLRDLAIMVAKDGEGARKFITVEIKGAKGKRAALKIARSVANSPLVKTAIAGEDANWGRVVMAVGKAGEAADRDKLSIAFGPHVVAANGARVPDYSEEDVTNYMRGENITITADLGIGKGRATMWTCDLTKDYVAINGDYRS